MGPPVVLLGLQQAGARASLPEEEAEEGMEEGEATVRGGVTSGKLEERRLICWRCGHPSMMDDCEISDGGDDDGLDGCYDGLADEIDPRDCRPSL